MTARASTLEASCSSCRELVLRACGRELAAAPSCSSCGLVVCDDCRLLELCAACFDDRLGLLRELVEER